jgi:hypothetical protein
VSNNRRLVRGIIQQRIDLEFSLQDRTIQRQTTTVIEVPDSAGSRVTVRGATAISPDHWAIYEGQYGTWQALVSNSMRVGQPQEIA